MYCTKCLTENDDDAAVCANCGSALTRTTSAEERDGPPWEKRRSALDLSALLATIWVVLLRPANTFSRMVREKGLAGPIVFTVILVSSITAVSLSLRERSLDDNEDRVRTINLKGYIYVDTDASEVNLSLEHRGGDPISWYDYLITLEGIHMSGHPRNGATGVIDVQSTVGESVYWRNDYSGSAFAVGGTYTVKVIDIDSSNIAWEKKITARQ